MLIRVRYESVLAAVEISDDTRVSTLRGLFSLLPTVNRHLFAALMDHLHEVAKYAQTVRRCSNLLILSLLRSLVSSFHAAFVYLI